MVPGEAKVSSEKRLTDLLKDPSPSRLEDSNQPSIPKIQRVQPYLRQRKKFKMYYSPKLLSFGPIHHGHENLVLGENYKRRWTRAYLQDAKITETAAQQLRQNIASKIEDLKKLYSEDAIKEYKDKNKDDDDLIWTLFVDGCSVLHILKNAGNWDVQTAKTLEIKIDQLAILMQDMLLLENQLPYYLLKRLTDGKLNLEEYMLKLLQNHHMAPIPKSPDNTNHMAPKPKSPNNTNQRESANVINMESPPNHLLDLLRKTLLKSSPDESVKPGHKKAKDQGSESESGGGYQSLTYRVRNIQELKAAGIEVESTETASPGDVKFTPSLFWAVLKLPQIIVDDFTAPTFMNLIAYEMCPDFPNDFEISSYVAFLDLLIDHPADVKELRSARVLQNHLGNDEEVATLFNDISTDLIADASKYSFVRHQIEAYCNAKWKIWMAQVCHDHFSSPWTVIAFLTVVLVTGLTIVQTWFAIKPPR